MLHPENVIDGPPALVIKEAIEVQHDLYLKGFGTYLPFGNIFSQLVFEILSLSSQIVYGKSRGTSQFSNRLFSSSVDGLKIFYETWTPPKAKKLLIIPARLW